MCVCMCACVCMYVCVCVYVSCFPLVAQPLFPHCLPRWLTPPPFPLRPPPYTVLTNPFLQTHSLPRPPPSYRGLAREQEADVLAFLGRRHRERDDCADCKEGTLSEHDAELVARCIYMVGVGARGVGSRRSMQGPGKHVGLGVATGSGRAGCRIAKASVRV